MADVAAPRPSRTASLRTALTIAGVLAAAVVILRISNPERFAWVRTFFVIFGSLVIQALPFVLLGALAAAISSVQAPGDPFATLAPAARFGHVL